MANNAWKEGFCDAVQGRECKSPWSDQGFKAIKRNAQYLSGYMDGEANLARCGKRPKTQATTLAEGVSNAAVRPSNEDATQSRESFYTITND